MHFYLMQVQSSAQMEAVSQTTQVTNKSNTIPNGGHPVVDPNIGHPIVEIKPVPDAPPIRTSPQATPESFLNYGIQGVVVALVLGLGKPLIDRLALLLNERAKQRNIKEEKALDAQIKQKDIVQQSMVDQQEFLQQLLMDQKEYFQNSLDKQQVAHTDRVNIMMDILKDHLYRVDATTTAQITELKFLISTCTEKLDHTVPVKVVGISSDTPLPVELKGQPVEVVIQQEPTDQGTVKITPLTRIPEGKKCEEPPFQMQ
jgi:hypothetical protein